MACFFMFELMDITVSVVKMAVCEICSFYVVCFLLGNYPASGIYMPTFRNTLFHIHRHAYEDGTDRVFRKVGI